jgi:hypothetical protein
MAEQQLFCDPDDRHRAVLVAGCLQDLGQPTRLVDEPEAPAPRALLLWTHRASRSPWLTQLLRDRRDLIVVAIDAAPLPADCPHVLMLTSWPARSADRSLGELVSWLNGASGPGPFARRAKAAREPGGGSALLVLGLLALLVGAVVLGSRGSERPEDGLRESSGAPEPARSVAIESRFTGQAGTGTRARPAPGSGQGAVAVDDRVNLGRSSAADGDTVPVDTAALAPASSEPVSAAIRSEPLVPAVPTPAAEAPPAGNSSLDHLCRSRNLASARAWYRVLTPRQRGLAPELPCVRALLSRPGFEPLREEIQA